ncbi:hypothetical protein JCM10914A_31810 [Paenibacillus sp. JCM 10914]
MKTGWLFAGRPFFNEKMGFSALSLITVERLGLQKDAIMQQFHLITGDLTKSLQICRLLWTYPSF